jgi:hypothetical protein
MMYQSQAACFDAAAANAARTVTDSTPTAPPTFQPADLTAALAEKQRVVAMLPLPECIHCGTTKPTVVQRHDGDVVMYCKGEGGCGKSHWLFKCPDLRVPVYEQCCPFEKEQPPAPQPTSQAPPPSSEGDASQLQATSQEEVLQRLEASLADPIQRFARGEIDAYQLHGVGRPDERCARCSRKRSDHKTDCDTNGWRVSEYRVQKLPREWPEV